MWIKLNLYETYNQLINQKNESEKDQELAKLYGLKLKNDHSKKSFKGYVSKLKVDSSYFYLKLYESSELEKAANGIKANPLRDRCEHINYFKEYDLLLLSNEELDT